MQKQMPKETPYSTSLRKKSAHMPSQPRAATAGEIPYQKHSTHTFPPKTNRFIIVTRKKNLPFQPTNKNTRPAKQFSLKSSHKFLTAIYFFLWKEAGFQDSKLSA